MSGDIKQLKVGDPAPEPDDGLYHVIAVDDDLQLVHIQWKAKGVTLCCEVPKEEFEAWFEKAAMQ